MSYTQAQLVRKVRDLLGEDVKWQTLGTAANAADTTIDVTDGTDWEEGDILEWESDGDQAYVQSVAANVLTVIRGVNGTVAATHAGTACTKNPIYSFIKVTDALTAVTNTLWPYAWSTTTANFNPYTGAADQPFTRWYNLAATAIDLVSVKQLVETSTGSGVYTYADYGPGTGRPIIFSKQIPSSAATSGIGVQLPVHASIIASEVIYITYRLKHTLATVLAGDFENLVECVLWGAAARMLRAYPGAHLRADTRQWPGQDITDIAATADFWYSEHRRLLMDIHDEHLRQTPALSVWTPR